MKKMFEQTVVFSYRLIGSHSGRWRYIIVSSFGTRFDFTSPPYRSRNHAARAAVCKIKTVMRQIGKMNSEMPEFIKMMEKMDE